MQRFFLHVTEGRLVLRAASSGAAQHGCIMRIQNTSSIKGTGPWRLLSDENQGHEVE